jgi:hypothetical protein
MMESRLLPRIREKEGRCRLAGSRGIEQSGQE